ncbi:glycosyltransferase family 4 protein [Alkalibacterium sp. 20]|uniref:glycosyltransferase family 4 protein n=1 Tax=Alkalibacterium sp. 20 TaxID=1798803 RepID=UPI000911E2F4|nr:glycosyltransferase family 4 protein [Alkalibacterium sp. 20]OJF90258.1 hypothetical protein AX762_11790 [Alkalibacterium sp. 20]
MNVLKICFIVPNYPTKLDPTHTFVRELICEISDLGISSIAIAPQSITTSIRKKKPIRQIYWVDETVKGNKINIYQPKYMSFSKLKIFGNNISNLLFDMAVKRAFKKIDNRFDLLYAHFWNNSVVARELAEEYNLPIFVATGESTIWITDIYNKKKIYDSLDKITGVISVSKKNLNESKKMKLVKSDEGIVIPNSVNRDKFRPMNKQKARLELGLNSDSFIVAFTGAFNHRKGVKRLLEAIENLEDVRVILIGSGDIDSAGSKVLFSGQVPHDMVSKYLNCADVFALPTLAEGCSNAIVEALACGLPIISSNLEFNDELLNNDNSIRIDPNSIEELSEAIKVLRDDKELRQKKSDAALQTAEEFDIRNRAKKIISFINDKMTTNDV